MSNDNTTIGYGPTVIVKRVMSEQPGAANTQLIFPLNCNAAFREQLPNQGILIIGLCLWAFVLTHERCAAFRHMA